MLDIVDFGVIMRILVLEFLIFFCLENDMDVNRVYCGDCLAIQK